MRFHKRTLLKGIIWESWGLLALFILTWAWTGERGSASAVSLIYTAARTIGFYFYTRLWKKIEWGKEYIVGRTDSNIPCEKCGTELFKPYEMKTVNINGVRWYLCPGCQERYG